MRTHKARRSGFTLIELLVVVAIIALLISLLIPALSKARESARRVHCASGLRQWGFATYYYMNDYGNALPQEGDAADPTNEAFWYNALPPYVKAPKYYEIYAGINSRVGSTVTDSTTGATYKLDTSTGSGYKNSWIWYCQTRLQTAKNSSTSLNSFHYTFNDVLDGSGSYGGDAGPVNTKLSSIPEPNYTVLLFEDAQSNPLDNPNNMDPRHGSGTSNILFVDQHVETVTVTKKMQAPTLFAPTGYYTSLGNPKLVWGKFLQ